MKVFVGAVEADDEVILEGADGSIGDVPTVDVWRN
jgi:hypothetical protein